MTDLHHYNDPGLTDDSHIVEFTADGPVLGLSDERLKQEGYWFWQEFIAEAKQNNFEVVFLDIYMEDENGVEVAKELRSFDRNCILVFTTTSTDHALDGFKVRALQYLVKPYADEELNAVFKEII